MFDVPQIAGLPMAGQRPVIFHGVNKSGSLVMSDVLKDAYYKAQRANQFLSNYHGIPKDFDAFTDIMRNSSGHSFFVGHYIYGAVEVPDALWVTQVRHPMPRALSVHGWLSRNYREKHGSLEGFPDLRSWVLQMRGVKQTQMLQLAMKGPNFRTDWAKHPPQTMCAIALENLERDFAWFGLAEIFEESIFAMASICGLGAVSAWQMDTRNKWREPLAGQTGDLISMMLEIYRWEIEFYESAVKLFNRRIASLDFGPTLLQYKATCEGQYKERILGPAAAPGDVSQA